MEIYCLSKFMKILNKNSIRIKTFIRSLFFHIYSGCPKSTLQEIKYRYTICKSCDMFDNKKSQCMACGCNITDTSIFLNKLAWADQKCPIGKWDIIRK